MQGFHGVAGLYVPGGLYIFSIITKDQAEQSGQLTGKMFTTFPNLYHSTTITRF